ncbi:hypothetical protein [Eubacterium sp.]|uniref:hypothetical protein n=1 Tax=Eubacterium sp. TaxID=142586 RepID=UPI002FC90710
MKKKMFMLILLAVIVMIFAGCAQKEVSTEPLTNDEISDLYQNPNSYKGRIVNLSGKVFNIDENMVQIYADPINRAKNTMLDLSDAGGGQVSNDDFIQITGTVIGEFNGSNAFGASLKAPEIHVSEVKKSDYQTVVAPAQKTIEVNQTIDQSGCILTLKKIEFADSETRCYLSATNNSSDKLSIYSYGSKIIQNGKQYEVESNYDANYPSFSGDIMPSATVDAIIAFPKIEQKGFQLIVGAYNYDYSLNISDYTFDVTIN